MQNHKRSASLTGIIHLTEIDWFFPVYLMKSQPNEKLSIETLMENLAQKVRFLATQSLTEEYKYSRCGFIISHFGRRGVTFSLWYWANWDGTWELFNHGWYCYGRDFSKMEQLDKREPVLCHYELDLVFSESTLFFDIAKNAPSIDAAIHRYRMRYATT